MARLTINISDNLNKEMRKYVNDNDMTITIFLHLAITDYINKNKRLQNYLKENY